MEVLNDLVGYDNLKIYQNEEWFRFSLESILLPNFVTINMRDKMILDLCSGNAPIPLVLSTRTKAKIYGVEIQKEVCDLANKSIDYNELNNQITMINDDLKNLGNYFSGDNFDLITFNPPYFKQSETSIINKDVHKTIARHESNSLLNDILKISRFLLKNNGRLAFIHRTERLVEILELLKNNGFEPKKLQFIYPKEDSQSKLFMIEAVKSGKEGLKLYPPLFVHNFDGTYKDEILRIFQRGD